MVGDVITYSKANPVVRIKIGAQIATAYDQFTIDLAHELHMVATPELVRPTPVVVLPGLAEVAEIAVYPLVDQIADKICAMYERHGATGTPSTRYRDLHDLVLIVQTYELESDLLARAIAAESTRRGLTLPARIEPPGPQWAAGYRALAQRSQLPPDLHDLANALELVGRCLDPIIDGTRTAGRWSARTWTH